MREDEKDTLLTPRQVEVLRIKRKGMSQADIARMMKTTRGNISTIESTAMKNIEKAREDSEILPCHRGADLDNGPGRAPICTTSRPSCSKRPTERRSR